MEPQPADTKRLAALIDAKHSILVQLRQQSRRQLELIDQGDMSNLLVLLSSKQNLLGQLQKIEKAIDPYRNQEPESRRWETPQLRERTRKLSEQCQALLSEIMVIEKQGESDLVQRRDDAAQQLQGVHSSEQARGAYSRHASQASNGRRLDLSSES